jgi:AP-1 complex subunit gamma-1
VREEIAFLFVALVTQCPEIQSAVVNKLVITLNGLIPKAHLLSKQETLLQVSVWCIGEYGDLINHEDMTEENMIKLLVQILVSQQLSSMTKAFVLTSLLKLSDRWPAYTEQIKAIVSQYRSCIDVEIQQRSYEYANLLKWPDVSKIVLAKMPAFTVQHYLMQENEESNGKDQAPSESAEHKSQQVEIPSAKNILPVSTEEEANPLLDLITTKHVKPTNTPEPDANYLDTLLSQATVKEASLVDFAAADIANVSHTFSQTLHIYDKNGLQIDFELSKPEPNALNTTEIKVSFTNQLSHALSNFNFLAAVPKYINMDIFKASSDVIPPKSAGKVTQRIALKNTMHGEKPLVMKYKVSYTCQGTNENIVEQGAVNNFPKNF